MIKKLKIKLKTGDPVIVNTGQNKGKIDYIFKIDRNKGLVYLKNVSRKKFDLSTFESKKESKIKEIMIPIHISNISYWMEDRKEPTKLGFSLDENGIKTRVSRKYKVST